MGTESLLENSLGRLMRGLENNIKLGLCKVGCNNGR
jgi:hypothetical protein